MKQLKKLNLLYLLCLFAIRVSAQTCTINQTDTVLCAGTTVNFTVTTSGGTPISWAWAFGDGFTANTATPGHTYVTDGNYVPTVTVTFSGGATCTVNGKNTRVFAKPNAKFVITTEDTMCFRNNQLCVLDQSTVGSSNSPLKKRVFQLSNGYIDIDTTPPFSPDICYKDIVDGSGHLFSLVLEVTDENNCVGRLQKIDSVLLLPIMKPADFGYSAPPTCNTIIASFTNFTTIPLAEIKSFTWIFGDGAVDQTNWTSTTHIYSGDGRYVSRLAIVDRFGCTDTALSSQVIENIIPDSNIYGPFTSCYSTGMILKYRSKNPAATTIWELLDADNNLIGGGGGDSLEWPFETCGIYTLRMKLFFPDCYIEVDSVIQIYGPKTIIEEKAVPGHQVLNGHLCEVFDTVFFKSPTPYLSCMSGNGVKSHLWDFGDAFAPPCTTDTHNGINVGVNCNFSLDSMQVYHVYTPGQDQCYKAKLVIMDPITGCSHPDSIYLALTAPDAGPDTTAVPPRRGLYFIGTPCMGNMITFMFQETLPLCGYKKAWINFDSACGINNFMMVDSMNIRQFMYSYNSTCSNDGWITVGLVLENGFDKLGNRCYDTAWYHHFFRMFPIHPAIDIKITPSCFPMFVQVQPNDSIQYNLARVRWNFDPYSSVPYDTVTQFMGPNDSIIYSYQRQYNKKGSHSISAVYTDIAGCSRVDIAGFALGYKINGGVSKEIACVNDSVLFSERIRYYRYGEFDTLNHTDYWADSTRALAGKEKLWWDFGDGSGFTAATHYTGHRYTKPGSYTVRLAAQDSVGCLDTLVFHNMITIVKPQANIAGLESEYYCAPQIVAYRDSTLFLDSLGNIEVAPVDRVSSYTWEFGDETAASILKDPAHNYRRNGTFMALLTITTFEGCTDTASALIHMKGPQPSFMIRDTLGCEPFTTTFINTTDTVLRSFTWQFGDPGNQTFTTLTGDSVSFTYTIPGVYSVKLLGVENVFNPNTGNTIICNAFFPDPLTDLPERKVYVLGIPPMDVIVKDTVCLNEPIVFVANGDSVYNGYKWTFGDGGSYNGTRPDTTAEHTYLIAGVYAMQLIPVHSMGFECIDTVHKNIVAIPIEARFVIDSSKSPDYTFINQSPGGVKYEWDFGKPDAGAVNSSTSKDGLFKYQDAGTYTVCLTAYNTENCWDSTCEVLQILESHVIIPNVFTPDNNDNKNDAFDIDIVGYTQYELKIYNRWGALVFEGNTDGIRNDGINWNGLVRNEGEECPAGTYYFIFTYQLITEAKATTVHGTVTLIRDK